MANQAFEDQKGKGITTTEKARELGKKGGLASGIAKRRQKTLSERYEIAFDILTKKMAEGALKRGDKDIAAEVDEVGAEVMEMMAIATNKKIKVETRLRALEAIQDRMVGKPKQQTELTGADGEPLNSAPPIINVYPVKAKDEEEN